MSETFKWPKSITFIRHARSAYNALKAKRQDTDLYQAFLAEYGNWDCDHGNPNEALIVLAQQVKDRFALGTGDHNTRLDEDAWLQAEEMGKNLSMETDLPDVIFYSPYHRTIETMRAMQEGWAFLGKVKEVEEERVREQEHGLALLYNDWKVFTVFYPDQRRLRKLEGNYWYKFPQGENVPMVRDRNRLFYDALIRDYSGKNVMVITHHLNILAHRANLERWGSELFLGIDKSNKPINCGVTRYVQTATPSGQKLELEYYNKCLYKQ